MTTAKSPLGAAASTPDANDPTNPLDTVSRARPAVASDGSAQLLGLTVWHPSTAVCVVTVSGDLNMLTAPLLDRCIRQQLAAAPTHLVVDLESVGFLGCSGLNSLIEARALTQQNTATQLHLSGVGTRRLARVLHITELLRLFNTYPTLADALAARHEPPAGS